MERYIVRWKNHNRAKAQEVSEQGWTIHDAVDYAFAISKNRKVEVAVLQDDTTRAYMLCMIYPDSF